MTKRKLLLILAVPAVVAAGIAYADIGNMRTAVEFYKRHTHDDDGMTHDGPQHGGGLDRYGCHNASVPYHCHR